MYVYTVTVNIVCMSASDMCSTVYVQCDNKYFKLLLQITALYLLQIWKTNGKLQRWFTRTWLSECKVMYWYIKYMKY